MPSGRGLSGTVSWLGGRGHGSVLREGGRGAVGSWLELGEGSVGSYGLGCGESTFDLIMITLVYRDRRGSGKKFSREVVLNGF